MGEKKKKKKWEELEWESSLLKSGKTCDCAVLLWAIEGSKKPVTAIAPGFGPFDEFRE
ncbi:hypothetical protein T4D_3789 [Trichinella pseudospiralis]|uniref:Uncharacterized protein n=1 Tax=Trichinella pseudospiralis TaxID=6337 RepID=A0A0V1G1M0_TRIPS|nr:hypothetical protein T4D_3789 [Trichinella pseudospiralis]